MGWLFSSFYNVYFLAELENAQNTLINLFQSNRELHAGLLAVNEKINANPPQRLAGMITREILYSDTEFRGSIGEVAQVLGNLEWEGSRHTNWTLTFGDNNNVNIMSVPDYMLADIIRIIQEHSANDTGLMELKVVTARYVVSGGLTFKSSTNARRRKGFQLRHIQPVEVTASLRCRVTSENEIIVEGSGDHVIAINYETLKLRNRRQRLRFSKPPEDSRPFPTPAPIVDVVDSSPFPPPAPIADVVDSRPFPPPAPIVDVHHAKDVLLQLAYVIGPAIAMFAMFLIGARFNKPFQAPEQTVAMEVHCPNDMHFQIVMLNA